MENKVFIDTNFWIALYSPLDSLHTKAEIFSQKLKNSGYQFYISNYIFSETTTILSQRAGRQEAVVVGNYLLENKDMTIFFVDRNLQELSWEIFCETKKKNTSFVDCSTVAIMKAEGINSLLTFDQEDFAPLLKKHHLKFVV